MTWVDFDWTKRVAWDTFDIDRADAMVKVGMRLIGELVRDRRLRLQLTQAELGRSVGVHQSIISRLENGRLRGMRFWKFARLVAVLGGLDPNGPVPHWVIVRHGWHRARDIPVTDPRWYEPDGIGIALERGLLELNEISGIGSSTPRPLSRFAMAIDEDDVEVDEDEGAAGDPAADLESAMTRSVEWRYAAEGHASNGVDSGR